MSELRDAAENVLIHYSMGWELDEMMERLQQALERDRRADVKEAEE